MVAQTYDIHVDLTSCSPDINLCIQLPGPQVLAQHYIAGSRLGGTRVVTRRIIVTKRIVASGIGQGLEGE